jgi:ribosomal protein L36
VTTQADWVKELRDPSSDIGDVICGCVGDDWSEDKFKANAEVAISFISKVESLAQQRTEKKWRDCLDVRRDGKVYVDITKLKEIADLLK